MMLCMETLLTRLLPATYTCEVCMLAAALAYGE